MTVPALGAGVGFKPQHRDEVLAHAAPGFFVEIHPENYFMAGGPRLAALEAVRARHPVSVHGTGLSLASPGPLDQDHLAALKALCDRIEPALVSEHLAWNRFGGRYSPDLFPFPRTHGALQRLCDHIDQAQARLGRRLLIENPAHYLLLRGHEMDEVELLTEACRRTGCGLLLDLNNLHVAETNVGAPARDFIARLPTDLIGEIHIAGASPDPDLGSALLIDSHDAPVAEPVFDLLAETVARVGPRPVLVERDARIPPFAELAAEAGRAARLLEAAMVHA